MKILFRIFKISVSSLFALILFSCANQLPPSGGEDDKIPPKFSSIFPVPGSVNIKGNEIIIEFDEYVDRRSFEESFFMSPKPKGKQEFDWSGKKVTVKYESDFEKEKTYNITIGTGLKDVRAGNKLGSPVQFAFSTGDKIDNCKINGKVFVKNEGYIVIFAYKMDANMIANPEKDSPDYFALLNANGTYSLNNLSTGTYRLFAVKDNDRNFRYDKGFEEISMTDKDIEVNDTSVYYKADFLLMKLNFDALDSKFINSFSSDSLKIIYSSIKSGISIPIEYKFYFIFKLPDFSKFEIADNISLLDTVRKINNKLVFNWITDSLLEVFPMEKLNFGTAYEMILDYSNTKRKYYYSIPFATIEEKKFSKVSGIVTLNSEIGTPVSVNLIDDTDPINRYSITIKNDSVFVFPRIPAGDYYLFAFLNKNADNIFEKGSYNPFVPSGKFYMTDKLINIRGKMDYEKIIINFEK